MERFDIAIIGTGPAGISAAITAAIRDKNILLIGSEPVSSKVTLSERILNYPGMINVSGAELSERFYEHLDSLGVKPLIKQVNAVYAMGGYFSLQTSDAAIYEAKTVILACGVSTQKSIEGEDSFIGRGVSYCATCDGQFYKGKTTAVLGFNEESVHDSVFLAGLAAKLVFFPCGKNAPNVLEKAREEFKGINNISVIENETPVSILGGIKADKLVTDVSAVPVDGVFIIRDHIAPDKLVPGLKLSNGHVEADRSLKTNIPGLFAAGDVSGVPYQYIKAAGEGNTAALSAISYLANIKN